MKIEDVEVEMRVYDKADGQKGTVTKVVGDKVYVMWDRDPITALWVYAGQIEELDSPPATYKVKITVTLHETPEEKVLGEFSEEGLELIRQIDTGEGMGRVDSIMLPRTEIAEIMEKLNRGVRDYNQITGR